MSARGPRVCVVGAGAFGGWTALALARRGAAVTLLDAWGPGNARASSGGETRLIRTAYGVREHYTVMAVRALHDWQAFERESGERLLSRTGVLWIVEGTTSFGETSARTLAASGVRLEAWSAADAARRYPQVDFSGVESVLFEPDAGYLLSRRACAAVAARVEAAGGTCRTGAVTSPVDIPERAGAPVALRDGRTIEADAWVFACGPWLGALFPDVIGTGITPTRQEVYYFGPPAGDPRFSEPHLPAWIAMGERQVYGIPANAHHAFKIADDTPGPVIDPTGGDRTPTSAGIAAARAFLVRRFPGLVDAPLVGSEVCQYEATPDAELVIDRHPRAAHVWIVGGGSGHGFKLGPAVGDRVAAHVLDEAAPDPRFAIARLSQPPVSGWRKKWI